MRARKSGGNRSLWMLDISVCTCPYAQVYTRIGPLLPVGGLAALCRNSTQKAAWLRGTWQRPPVQQEFSWPILPVQLRLSGSQTAPSFLLSVSLLLKAARSIESLATLRPSYTPHLSHSSHTVRLTVSSPCPQEDRVTRTSRLRKGKACSFERWIVNVCLHRVPEIHPRQFPSQPPHPGSSATSCGQSQI